MLLGIIIMSSQSGVISSTLDPREAHQGEFTGQGTFLVGNLTDTCYRFYNIASDVELTVELYSVEGSSLGSSALAQHECLSDFQPMTAESIEFVERASWKLIESGEYAVVISCASPCVNETGWFVSISAMQEGIFGAPILMLGFSICCLGILTAPIALIVFFSSKPSQSPRVMMIGKDGQFIPITDLHPDHPTFFDQEHQALKHNTTVPPPFADTAEKKNSQDFVDGLPEVTAGTMLTTEQIYALMRGDVEGAHEHIKTRRFQATMAEEAVIDAANAAAIASWDEGVPLAKSVDGRVVEKTKNKQSEPSQPLEHSEYAWKAWDEQ